jgi:hypothetical protein
MTLFSVSETLGWIDGDGPITSHDVSSFLSGNTVNVGGGVILGGARTFSPSNRKWSTEVGVYTPQGGVSVTKAGRLGNVNSLWDGDTCSE